MLLISRIPLDLELSMVSRKYQNMKKIPRMVYIKPCVNNQCPSPPRYSDIPTVLIFSLTHILLNKMAPEEICLTALHAFQWFFVFTEITPMKCQTSLFKKRSLFFQRALCWRYLLNISRQNMHFFLIWRELFQSTLRVNFTQKVS